MATPEYRDGYVPWVAAKDSTLLSTLDNDQMNQLAGALQTSWVQIFNWGQDTAGAWSYRDNIDRGDATLIRGWYTSPASPALLYFEIAEHLHGRKGGILTDIRIKTGGSVNGGSAKLRREEAFTSGTSYPGAPADVDTIFSAGDNVFNGPHLSEKNLSVTMAAGYRYFIEITSPTGAVYVAGVQVKIHPPIVPV